MEFSPKNELFDELSLLSKILHELNLEKKFTKNNSYFLFEKWSFVFAALSLSSLNSRQSNWCYKTAIHFIVMHSQKETKLEIKFRINTDNLYESIKLQIPLRDPQRQTQNSDVFNSYIKNIYFLLSQFLFLPFDFLSIFNTWFLDVFSECNYKLTSNMLLHSLKRKKTYKLFST